MATIEEGFGQEKSRGETGQFLAGSLAFDWGAIIVYAWLIVGLYADGWAHNHIPDLETFFTPWHAIFYSGYLAIAVYFTTHWFLNRRRGYAWTSALPQGYGWTALGIIVFLCGGVGDMIWHLLFGIEVSVEALLSPTHLMLALGAILMVSGPLRAAWLRYAPGDGYGWREFLPILLSITFVLALFGFFTQYAHPFVDTWAAPDHALRQQPQIVGTQPNDTFNQQVGVTSILIQTAIAMGVILLLLRRWGLPFGALTLIFTLPTILISFMGDEYLLILAAVVGGLIADLLLWRIKPSITRPGAWRLFAFLVPLEFYCIYFLQVFLEKGLIWSIHLWLGSAVVAGVIGLLLSYLVVPPLTRPDELKQ